MPILGVTATTKDGRSLGAAVDCRPQGDPITGATLPKGFAFEPMSSVGGRIDLVALAMSPLAIALSNKRVCSGDTGLQAKGRAHTHKTERQVTCAHTGTRAHSADGLELGRIRELVHLQRVEKVSDGLAVAQGLHDRVDETRVSDVAEACPARDKPAAACASGSRRAAARGE